MPRALLTLRGLTVVGLVLVFGFGCYVLGRWQWSRYEDKQVRADAVALNYGANPAPLSTVLPTPDTVLREDQAWSHVTVTGRYAVDRQLLVRGRPLQSEPGMEVLVPLDVGGRLLLVDRGWVPNAETAAALPDVPPAPNGPVSVTGWLKPSEPSRGRDLPAGQLASVNVDDARAHVGAPLYSAYLVLGEERTASGATPPRPTPLERPTGDLGPHQAYAFQWWATALLGVGFLVMVARNNSERLGSAARSAKPKRVRIWDEEDG